MVVVVIGFSSSNLCWYVWVSVNILDPNILICLCLCHSGEEAWTDALLYALKENILISILCLFTFAVFLSVAGLLIYHLNLISNAETTNEQIRGRYALHPNPYDRGCLYNYYNVLFTKLPPSQLHLREEVSMRNKLCVCVCIIIAYWLVCMCMYNNYLLTYTVYISCVHVFGGVWLRSFLINAYQNPDFYSLSLALSSWILWKSIAMLLKVPDLDSLATLNSFNARVGNYFSQFCNGSSWPWSSPVLVLQMIHSVIERELFWIFFGICKLLKSFFPDRVSYTVRSIKPS